MNGQDYISMQMTMIKMGQQASKLDFDSFLKAISKAETVGPFVDPTLYLRAQDNLNAIKKLALASQQVKTAFEEIQASIIKTAAEMLAQQEDNDSEHA